MALMANPDARPARLIERGKGGLGNGRRCRKFSAREIDDQTPVKVVSSDDNGAIIEIIEGPMKGQSGFVAKQNLD
jgi:hypothetical protein